MSSLRKEGEELELQELMQEVQPPCRVRDGDAGGELARDLFRKQRRIERVGDKRGREGDGEREGSGHSRGWEEPSPEQREDEEVL